MAETAGWSERDGPFDVWCPDLRAAIDAPFAADEVSWKEKENKKTRSKVKIPFVSWHHYVARLNALVGNGWSTHKPEVIPGVGGKLLVMVGITILDQTHWQVGDDDEDSDGYGTAVTNAVAQALKRCCAMFGLGLYLYDKDERKALLGERDGPRGNGQRRQADTGNGLAPKQEVDALLRLASAPEIEEKIREHIRKVSAEGRLTRAKCADYHERIRAQIDSLRQQRVQADTPEPQQAEAFANGSGQGGVPSSRRQSPQAAGR